MKLLLIEDANIKKHLIERATTGLNISIITFPSLNEVFDHIQHDLTPFIFISEIISTSESQLRNIYRALMLAHFKGIIFVSKYGDDVIDVVKHIGRYMGYDNIYGICLPVTLSQIKEKVLQIIHDKKSKVMKYNSSSKLSIDEVDMALVNDLFQPYFQVQVSSLTEKVKGFEILSRLCIGNYVCTPDAFIETLVDHKRITEFTFTILKKALCSVKNYSEFNGSLSLNVDYQSLEYFDFAKKIIQILQDAEFPVNRFTVEITENSPTINIFVLHNLALLRMSECHLSIDDFGTQGSGFTELLQLPFSELKIDKTFVHDMLESPRAYKVVKALCAVAKSLDCSIVAEGVESHEQRVLLRELGVCRIQGYLYSKPKAIDEAMEILKV